MQLIFSAQVTHITVRQLINIYALTILSLMVLHACGCVSFCVIHKTLDRKKQSIYC